MQAMSSAGPALQTDPRVAALMASLSFDDGQPLGKSNQGEVRRFTREDLDLAIKTPSGRGLSRWARRKTLEREHAAYCRLAGLPGLAHCHGLFERRFLVLDFVTGRPMRKAEIGDRDRFFARLLETIQAMHARGVAHGDLKRKDNLLVATDETPVILDLGAAVVEKRGRHPVNRRLFRFMCQTDLNAWVKLKYGGYTGIARHDQAYLHRSRLERLLTRLRRP